MKLKSISLRNFRSYTNNHGEPAHRLNLGDGLNVLVGPNNCGKSNLLRAVSLALEDSGGAHFNSAQDVPSQLQRAYPAISLRFRSKAKSGVEKTLLNLLAEYEHSAGATKTNTDNGDIVLRVMYRNSVRDVSFGVRGSATKRGDPEKLDRALTQFKKCVRFIYLRSGESLTNFLAGAFRELLHTVRQEHLSDEVLRGQKLRDGFIDKLKQDLLTPLGDHIRKDLKQVLAEVEEVSIMPLVPELDEILSGAEITIKDTADTALLNKGTGVRGALLVALLTYLAKHSRRSLILAVEEPESFLHPRAQQDLRDNLMKLAKGHDVSLLVTTHSPFMLSRSAKTVVTPLSKSLDGRTIIGGQIRGDEPHSSVVTALFGETITPALLDIVQPPKDGIRAILFVEGYTDKVYLETALRVANRLDLLEGIEVRYAEGAHKAAVQAILVRQMLGEQMPVGVLLDADEFGRSARELLTDKFRWNGKRVFPYRKWRPDPSSAPVEAEDMFDEGLLKRFVKQHPPNVIAETMQYKDGTFHYGFTQDGKGAFLEFIEKHLKTHDLGRWLSVVEDVRMSLGLTGEK